MLLLIAVGLANTVSAQGKSTNSVAESSPLNFSEVVTLKSVPAAELYTRAKVWFATAFSDSKAVLEVQDKEAGVLVGKGSIPYEPNISMSSSLIRGHVTFSISISFKDGRYKYTLSDFTHHGSTLRAQGPISFGLITTSEVCPTVSGTSKGMRDKVWKHLKEVSATKANTLITSLKHKLAQPIDGKDSW